MFKNLIDQRDKGTRTCFYDKVLVYIMNITVYVVKFIAETIACEIIGVK